MNLQEKMIARILFKNKVLSADAQVFENLFTSIFGYARPDFRQVKPQGNLGDRKNDGFEPASGRYYQVYAPENVQEKESSAIKKLEGDFDGLKSFWAGIYPVGIKEYFFVLNDKYKGAYPTTYQALAELQKKHCLDKAEVIACKHLEDVIFDELQEEHVYTIVGFLPDTTTIVKLDYSVLTEVVAHVLANTPNNAVQGKLVTPEFETKLVFNDLKVAASFLKAGSYQDNAVESFFKLNANFARHAVRQSLNDMYINAKTQGFVSDPISGLTAQDQIYFDVLASATPNSFSGDKRATPKAVQVLLSYFFESCDIFEEPINVTS
ncbi:ABC-three component system protein [Janthinobacterium sp. RT4P48]|uniref:ABC-three component system protein n=1 Tax=Janthinobacterium sp. RT4P48 TaxID=3424188 RepID=UPI003F23262B